MVEDAKASGSITTSPAIKLRGVVMLGPFAWDHAMPFGMSTLLSVMLRQLWGAPLWAGYYKSLYKDVPPSGR